MKAKTTITKEMFKTATGYEDQNDDLERCNCPKAGKMGHTDCGWNYKHNLPRFMSSDEN